MAFPRDLEHGHIRTPRASRSRRVRLRTRAFSLVELVVVVLIVAVLTAIAVPRFTESAARARVTAAAERLGAEIVMTGERARAASAMHGLGVTRNSGKITIVGPDKNVIATRDLGVEPYLATVVRTDLAAGEVQFSGYALPNTSGRIMLRSAGYLAIVSIASDGVVSVSNSVPARAPDPVLADVVSELGDSLTVREIVATPGNTVAVVRAEDKGK